MRKRRLFFLTMLLAAGLAVGSTFFAWWPDALPAKTDFLQLISTETVDSTDWLLMSVAMVIYVGAGVTLLAGLFRSKIIGLVGLAINMAVAVLWIIMTGIIKAPGDFVAADFQLGSWLMAGSLLLMAIALLIPKRRKEKR